MDRRRFLLNSLAGALAGPLAGEAQQAGKIYRIGHLAPGAPPANPATPAREAYYQQLREFGFVIGQNITEDRRYAEGRLDRFPALAAELVRDKVDVIVAWTTPAVRAAKQATTTIPIVMSNVGDPVTDGLVASLARPGGNVTGLTQQFLEINDKTLELVRELLPKARRLAIIIQPDTPTARRQASHLQKSAHAIGIEVDVVEVRDEEDLQRRAEEMKRKKTDAVWFHTSVVRPTDPGVGTFAIRHRIPTIHESRIAVERGGLMSYGESDVVRLQRVARYVAKILQGTKPQELPVERSTYLELTINLKTAKALGLTIPPTLLLRADQVIE